MIENNVKAFHDENVHMGHVGENDGQCSQVENMFLENSDRQNLCSLAPYHSTFNQNIDAREHGFNGNISNNMNESFIKMTPFHQRFHEKIDNL